VTVIVPVWNDGERLRRCLSALRRQTLKSAYEVVIVDNGSTESTSEYAKLADNFVWIEETTPGSYAARNKGLSVARAPIVAFTDSDCIPASDWLEAGLRALALHEDAGVVAGDIQLFQDSAAPNPHQGCLAYERLFSMNQLQNVRRGVAMTANWFSPRSAIDAVGGFDSALKSGGDFAMARRIVEQGHAVVFARDAVVYHPIRGQLGELLSKRRRVIGGEWISTAPRWRFARLSFAHAKHFALRAIAAILHRECTLREKLAIVSVTFRLWLAGSLELARLRMGRAPRRS
jgi:GT2 family glycosyltransferase